MLRRPISTPLVKRLPDGRAMLNLGCGTRMHWDWNNLDFSPYACLRRRRLLVHFLASAKAISPERLKRLKLVDRDVIFWDLRRGIPFDRMAFDVVYHSHVLEHIELRDATKMLKECHRVLKPGGTIRVVVPDLEAIIDKYISARAGLKSGDIKAWEIHNEATHDLFWQMTCTAVMGTSEQKRWVRLFEGTLRRNARQAGQQHRWMYDRYSLEKQLGEAGFSRISVVDECTSRIEGWDRFGLDRNPDGRVYKPGSLYVEAIRMESGHSS